MRELALIVGTVAFAAFHPLWYTRVVALWLWELTGGIQRDGRVTVYGTSDWAWTVPLHLPPGSVLIGSLIAGFAAAELLLAWRQRPVLGRRWWRLWLFLAGWAWVPVPATASWVYQWTVVY
jgi:hypothetical protein